jgi:glycosyltransferase involved in cell wall biosynthesis
MRAGLQLEALGGSFGVHVAVLPVAGGSLDTRWARRFAESVEIVDPHLDLPRAGTGLVELLGNADVRGRLSSAGELPYAARVATPLLAGRVVEALRLTHPTPVHAVRAYLAPIAVAVGTALDAPWLTIDLDEDDAALLARSGRDSEAQAYNRMLGAFGSCFSWLSLAAPAEAQAIGALHALRTVVVPNAVTIPATTAARLQRQTEAATLLLVANLTYEPNIEAAELLARDILPRVRALTACDVRLELVGAFEPDGRATALEALEGVELCGYQEDLASAYARADAVVAPLVQGGGTRIKVLEALAYGVPVVTTPTGAAGLDVEDGRHLLLADSAEGIAAATAAVIADRRLAERLTRAGRELVEATYGRERIAARLRDLIPRSAASPRARPGTRGSR